MLLDGPPGSGKTCLVKMVMKKMLDSAVLGQESPADIIALAAKKVQQTVIKNKDL